MIEFFGKIYWWLLWLAGAALTDEEIDELHKTHGDRVTYWMRRSKKRLGKFWWLAVFFTLLIVNFRLYTAIRNKQWGWVTFTILFDVFSIYAIPHVAFGCW